MSTVYIKKIRPTAILPKQSTSGSIGWDLHACIDEPIILKIGQSALIPTGLNIMLPENSEMQIRARSSLAFKHNVIIPNGIGTVDSDYCDFDNENPFNFEIKVLLHKLFSTNTHEPSIIKHNISDANVITYENQFVINPGDRIAQAIFYNYDNFNMTEVKQFDKSNRKTNRVGGFGSTGQ